MNSRGPPARGVTLILLGGSNIATALLLGKNTKIIAYSVIIFTTCAVGGITQLQRWYKMREKYRHLHNLQKEMELN